MNIVRLSAVYRDAWAACAEYLEKALAAGGGIKDWDLADVRDLAGSGQVALWGLVEDGALVGAGVTSETVYPKRKVFEVLLLGTDPNTGLFEEALTQVREVAKSQGCDYLSGTGRPGWARAIGAKELRSWELPI